MLGTMWRQRETAERVNSNTLAVFFLYILRHLNIYFFFLVKRYVILYLFLVSLISLLLSPAVT